MKKLFISGLLAATITTPVVADVFVDADSTVEYRQAGFQAVRSNFSVIAGMMRGEREYSYAELNAATEGLQSSAQLPWAGFKFAGHHYTGKGDALHGIWDENSNFESYKNEFLQNVNALTKEVVSTDKGKASEYQGAFIKVARSCQQCHNDYRE